MGWVSTWLLQATSSYSLLYHICPRALYPRALCPLALYPLVHYPTALYPMACSKAPVVEV